MRGEEPLGTSAANEELREDASEPETRPSDFQSPKALNSELLGGRFIVILQRREKERDKEMVDKREIYK